MLQDAKDTTNQLIEWIRQYFNDNGPGCSAVIGISGGKDSAVVAALCTAALGKERVLGVLMPNGVQPDIDDAKEVVNYLDIPHVVVNVGDAVSALKKSLLSTITEATVPCFDGKDSLSVDSTVNLPARIRMTTLYAIGQNLPNGARVANTCNESEDYVGYSTKYGDAAGDFSPLANIVVEEVRQIGEVLGLPSRLVEKTPSDGLSGLSDEDNLGFTYAELDTYIRTGICNNKKTKERIDYLRQINLHKMQLMPSFIMSED